MFIHVQSQKRNQEMTSTSFGLFPETRSKQNITLQLALDPPPERGVASNAAECFVRFAKEISLSVEVDYVNSRF
jgi:hypothetical protein